MEFEAQIGAIAGSYADQFKGGAILSLLNASKNQRLRSLQLQNAAVSREHFALFFKARESVYCLVALDRVPLTAPAPTFPQVVGFTRALQEGRITSLKHNLVAHFAAPLVELQLVAEARLGERGGLTSAGAAAETNTPIGSHSEQQAREVPNILKQKGAVLVAVTITGRFTLWKYVDSDYSWHLSVVVELCPPTAMVTDVAFDSTTGLIFWSERQVNATSRQQLQDRIRGSQLYIDAGLQRVRACTPTTILPSTCSAAFAVPGGCWFVRDTTLMFFNRAHKRLASITLDESSAEGMLTCIHEQVDATERSAAQFVALIGNQIYVVQAADNALAVIWKQHLPQDVSSQTIVDIRALGGELLLVSTSGIAVVNLFDGELLVLNNFPESLTRTTEDRKFHLWVVPKDECKACTAHRARSCPRKGFTSHSNGLEFLQTGPMCGLWGETCLLEISITSRSSYSHHRLAVGMAELQAKEDRQQLVKDALSLLQERVERAGDIPALRRRSSATGAEASPQPIPSPENATSVKQSEASPSPTATWLIPPVEHGFESLAELDLLLASCTRGEESHSVEDATSGRNGVSGWLASLGNSMLPARSRQFDLYASFDPRHLISITSSLNSKFDRFYQGTCRFLLARHPDALYDVVMALSDMRRPSSSPTTMAGRKQHLALIDVGTFDLYDYLADCVTLGRALDVLHVDESRGSLTQRQQDALLKLLLAARRFTRAATALVAWHRFDDAAALCARLATAADMVKEPAQGALHRLSPGSKRRESRPATISAFPVMHVIPQPQLTKAAECMDVFRTTLLGCLFADRCDLLTEVFRGMPWFVTFKDIALLLQEANVTKSARNTSSTDLARTVASLIASESTRLTGHKLHSRHLKACLQAFREQEIRKHTAADAADM